MKTRIAIIGLGLIGGSFAKALSKHESYLIHGHDTSSRSKIAALADGAIAGDLERGAQYDLLVLALNPADIADVAARPPFDISADLIIDLSGVKSELSAELSELVRAGSYSDFLGMHTMAGKETSGYASSSATLFEGSSCILTPEADTKPESIALGKRLAYDLGCAQVIMSNPAAHDRIIAFTSQLAHLVSNSYVKSPLALKHAGFTGGSYQDLTRVAELDATMWTELCMSNREFLLPELESCITHLSELKAALAKSDKEQFEQLLAAGSRKKIAADAIARLKAALRKNRIDSEVSLAPSELSGVLEIPSSKSEAHRRLIATALCNYGERIEFIGLDISDDILATLSILAELGAELKLVELKGLRADLIIGGIDRELLAKTDVEIEVEESAASLRLTLPLSCALAQSVHLRLGAALARRPLEPLHEALQNHGVNIERISDREYRYHSELKAGPFRMRGDVSSQYISGLLFALPLLSEASEIVITTELESKGYLEMTCKTLGDFSIEIERNDERRFKIKPAQRYVLPSEQMRIEADYSSAAVWKIAQALGAHITLLGLDEKSLQPDRQLDNLIALLKNKDRSANEIDISEAPDLLPVLAVLAARTPGETHFVNAARLRIKESDRLESVAHLLRTAGVEVSLAQDSMTITGVEAFTAATFETQADHRLVMAATLIACFASGESRIKDADSVSKSYPGFFADLAHVGGKLS